MLLTSLDAPTSDAEWREFLLEQDFGQLVAAGRGRDVPVIVPAHYWFDGVAVIELHLHRDNPVFAALEESPHAVFSVIDAHAYVPAAWTAPRGGAAAWAPPASYYAAVHAIGTAEVLDQPSDVRALLQRQLAQLEAETRAGATRPRVDPFGPTLEAVRGVRLRVSAVRARFAFGGDLPPAHRMAIAARLAERRSPNDLRAWEHLLRRLVTEGARANATKVRARQPSPGERPTATKAASSIDGRAVTETRGSVRP